MRALVLEISYLTQSLCTPSALSPILGIRELNYSNFISQKTDADVQGLVQDHPAKKRHSKPGTQIW